MMTFREYSGRTKGVKTITIECRDYENTLESLLKHLKALGNSGHGFSIIVDPDEESKKDFYWDGDGSDHIYDVKTKFQKTN